MPSHAPVLAELRTIPCVGASIAEDFYDIGIRGVADLRNENPEALYEKICLKAGQHVDRCMLYVCRCAVYYATAKRHDLEKLQWWKWKDA
jgi:hypothetical protein